MGRVAGVNESSFAAGGLDSASGGDVAVTVRGLVIGVIRGYQRYISPGRLPVCRYVPSCSEYAVEAVSRHGAARGGVMAVRRLLRCHPLHKGGYDPVP